MKRRASIVANIVITGKTEAAINPRLRALHCGRMPANSAASPAPMNWTLVMIGFALAVLMGAGRAALLAGIRPQWSARKRGLIAASVLPVITMLATMLALLFILAGNYDATGQM